VGALRPSARWAIQPYTSREELGRIGNYDYVIVVIERLLKVSAMAFLYYFNVNGMPEYNL
jgi:hypothetical protein